MFGYVNTIKFSAKLMGVQDDQIRYINYGDYGMDLYSNAIIVSKKLVKENPKAVAGLVRAINKGLHRSGLAQGRVDARSTAVAKREPLIKVPVEKDRFIATLRSRRDEIIPDRQDRRFFGNIDPGTAEEVDRHPGRCATTCRAPPDGRRRYSRRPSCRTSRTCRRTLFQRGAATAVALSPGDGGRAPPLLRTFDDQATSERWTCSSKGASR